MDCICQVSLKVVGPRQVFFAGHIPQVTTTGHSIFAPKQHKKSLNSANRSRQALMYIFSKNMFRLGAQCAVTCTLWNVTCERNPSVSPPFVKFISVYIKMSFTQLENHSQLLCGCNFANERLLLCNLTFRAYN